MQDLHSCHALFDVYRWWRCLWKICYVRRLHYKLTLAG